MIWIRSFLAVFVALVALAGHSAHAMDEMVLDNFHQKHSWTNKLGLWRGGEGVIYVNGAIIIRKGGWFATVVAPRDECPDLAGNDLVFRASAPRGPAKLRLVAQYRDAGCKGDGFQGRLERDVMYLDPSRVDHEEHVHMTKFLGHDLNKRVHAFVWENVGSNDIVLSDSIDIDYTRNQYGCPMLPTSGRGEGN